MKRLLLLILLVFGLPSLSFTNTAIENTTRTNINLHFYTTGKITSKEFNQTIKLIDEKRYQEAILLYQKIISNCEEELQKEDIDTQTIRKIRTNIGICYYLIGISYYDQREYEKALLYFQKLKSTYAEETRLRAVAQIYLGKCYYKLAHCYLKKKDFSKAEEGFKKYINCYPLGKHIESAHLMLALCYMNQAKTRKGINELIKSGKLWSAVGITMAILTGGILLLVLIIFLTKLFYQKRRIAIPYPAIKWGLKDIIIVEICFLIFSVLSLLVLKNLLLSVLLVNLIVIGLIGYLVLFKYKLKISALGFRKLALKKAAVYCLSGVIIAIAFGFLYDFCLNRFFHIQYTQFIANFLLSLKLKKELFFAFIFITLIGPFCEEVFYRGFLYNGIKKYLGIRWAIVLSALLFGLMHLEWIGMIPLVFMGIIFSYLYERSGSLWTSIIAHILINTIAVVLLFN